MVVIQGKQDDIILAIKVSNLKCIAHILLRITIGPQ